MLHFIYGPEQNIVWELREQAKARAYKKAAVIGIDVATSEGFAEFSIALRSDSLFSINDTILVRNAFECPENLVVLLKKSDVASIHDVIIYCHGNKSFLKNLNPDLLQWLSKKSDKIDYADYLAGSSLRDWTTSYATKVGLPLDSQSATQLIRMLQDPTAYPKQSALQTITIKNEIDKITSYVRATGSTTTEAINAVVSPFVNYSIFDLVDAIGMRNRSGALGLLSKHLNSGSDESYLFSMVVRQYRLIAKVKSAQSSGITNVASATKIHPFVARKLSTQAGKYSSDELRSIYDRLCELDQNFKRGVEKLDEALCHFVINV